MRSTIYASYYWKYLSYSQRINKYLCIFTFAWILFFVYAVAVWFQSLQTVLLSVFLDMGIYVENNDPIES